MKMIIICVTVLLVSTGSLLSQTKWVKRYDGQAHNLDYAEDVKISGGKVYVAGSSWGANTNTDLAIVKYDLNTGSEEWVYRYNSPDSGSDNAQSIAFDSYGYIYITGMVHHSNSTGVDIFTASLTPSGGIRWIREFSGPGNLSDQGLKIMADNNRNVYVTGVTTPPSGDFDIIVIKYTELGNELWRRQYESPQVQMPKDMYVDKVTGEVFVTGYTGNNFPDYLTFMINSSGTIGWVKLYGGSLGDISNSIGHDQLTGDIYVTGQTESSGTGVSISTVKYRRNGNELWHHVYNAPVSGGNAYGNDIESVGSCIYVSGYSNESNLSQSEGLIVGLDSNGSYMWKTSYAARFGNFSSQNIPSDMKVDHFGRAYVSASVKDSSFGIGTDFMFIMVNPYGNALINRYNSTFSDFTSAVAISDKHTVITGQSDTAGHSSDMLTAAFNFGGGNFKSVRYSSIGPVQTMFDTIGPVHRYADYGDAVPLMKVTLTIDTLVFPRDGDLEIFLEHNNITDTVIFHQGGTGSNFISTVLDDSASFSITSGTAPFTGTFRPHRPLSVFNTSDAEGLWVLKVKNTGSSSGTLKGWGLDFEIDESTIGIEPVIGEIPGSFNLFQNYPNPFNPSTHIKFEIPFSQKKSVFVSLKVYDIRGREVAVPVKEYLSAGSNDIVFDGANFSTGVYFYRLEAEDFSLTKKMLLIK